MSQEDGTKVPSLDLVEARVHLAAAQYHNSLANGKLVPRPPSAPRSRPASAGARPGAGVVDSPNARPWSAQSVHSCPPNSGSALRRAELLEAQRMDSATDALAVLLGPWGNCCYQAPPGVITTTLHEIADMLRISATRRDRRKNLVLSSRQKFLPRSPESLERLHASIIGRALGRSFANVLLLTKVLMAFREALHTSELHSALTRRTRWLQREKSQVDERCLEYHFYAWLHHSTANGQKRAAEAEILRGREALVEVYSQGREELFKVVDSLYNRLMEQRLLVCLSAWRDALRLSSLEGYGYHLVSMRQRTPKRVEDLFLSQVSEVSLLVCLICWAASVALQRQGRLLKERETSIQELEELTEHRQQQLQRCDAQKEHLSCSSRAFVCRSIQHAERQLVEATFGHWWHLNQTQRRRQQSLQALQQRKGWMALRQMVQGWQLMVWQHRRKNHAMRQGLRAVARWEEQQRSAILLEWTRVTRQRKAEELLRCKGERRRIFAERRFEACSTQQLCLAWDAWRGSLRSAAERLARVQRALLVGNERLEAVALVMTLRIFGAWHLSALENRRETQRREVQVRQQRAMSDAANHAQLALQRCQEPGSFHCRLLCEWRLLVVQRKTREAQRRSSVKWVASKEAHLQETILAACLRFWHEAAEQHGSQRAKAQALREAQQEMHLKSLNALRRRQESEDDALEQLHFSAWHQHLLNVKIAKVEKEKAMARTFGQLMLDDEMLRSRSFYQWRDALHAARQDALHEAQAQEAEERRKEDYEKRLQVMREAFRSSSEALLVSSFLGWHSVARHGKSHSSAAAARERLNLRMSHEGERFLTFQSFLAWQLHVTKQSLRRKRRSACARIGDQMLDILHLRQVQGLTSVEARSFQAQLLELWRQEVLREQFLRHQRRLVRRGARRICEESLLPVEDRAVTSHALQHWHQLCIRLSLLRRWKDSRERVPLWLSRQQQQSLQRCLWDVWRQEASERRSQQRVAASCQNIREVQLHVRDRMLNALERLLEESVKGDLQVLLLRWRSWSDCMRWRRRIKENGYVTSRRCAENDLIQWCSWLFYTWATEARERRQRSISEHLERQVSGARVVQSQMTQGWQRAVAALWRQQITGLQRQLQDALRSWSFRSAWKKRYQRRLCSLLCCAHRARDLRRYMWRWQVMLLQEKSANRVERSRRHVDSFISRLHSAWLLQQTLTSWQHARAYEELFRILSDTQADLARAAEATALAETAAVAAQQRNQQVTVRVLPSPAWPKPEVLRPQPSSQITASRCPATRFEVEEEASSHFRAPVVSLQKDIQRHYAQRLQELQTRGSGQKPCSFEVNLAQGAVEAPRPATREAWRSP